eukprot:CAMPEP_0170499908 /NCGR_PEP_ID=MMETSP0208-20121228/33032_1 /TAXON_ID=197538 /ORGANISM="Strombidium inclinatum, Strain S3" /LENGTH=118 /DNA_ID=CAMNT_0010777675 /DNA_START=258 /DNA_END=614 /DNA_ORIENTATION=-
MSCMDEQESEPGETDSTQLSLTSGGLVELFIENYSHHIGESLSLDDKCREVNDCDGKTYCTEVKLVYKETLNNAVTNTNVYERGFCMNNCSEEFMLSANGVEVDVTIYCKKETCSVTC